MKKLRYLCLLLLMLFLVTGCGNFLEGDDSDSYTLNINMPFSFDELDEFEEGLNKLLEEYDVGVIVGDGISIGDDGPTSTDIEIDVEKGKFDTFKDILNNYNFPENSNVNSDGDVLMEFGNLKGVVVTVEGDEDDANDIYKVLRQKLKDKYEYISKVKFGNIYSIYIYGNNSDEVYNIVKNEISSRGLGDSVEVIKK